MFFIFARTWLLLYRAFTSVARLVSISVFLASTATAASPSRVWTLNDAVNLRAFGSMSWPLFLPLLFLFVQYYQMHIDVQILWPY